MESTVTSVAKHIVQEITWLGRTYLAKRATVAFDQLHTFFGETYGAMYHALGARGLSPQGMPGAIYYRVDEAGNSTDLAASVPVPEDMKPIEGFELVHVPAGKALQLEFAGPYDGMHGAYAAMESYVQKHGLRTQLMLEEYLNDPDTVADPSQLRTNIIWMVA